MALVRVVPPAVEPVSLAAARDYLSLDSTERDPLLAGLIGAARQQIEGPRGIYELALITQTWEWSIDVFPTVAPYLLTFPLRPVQSIETISYAGGGVLPPEGFQGDLISDPPRLYPPSGGTWPVASAVPNAVTVRFVAGFGDSEDDVPLDIKQAILLTIDHWFEYRDAISPAGIEFPRVAEALLHHYWRPYV